MNKTIQSQLLELGYTLKSTDSDSIKTAVKTKKKAKKVQQAKVEFKRYNIFDNKTKRKKKVKRKRCQFCGNRIKLTKLDEHVAKAHPENTTENIASRGYAIYPICKLCGVEVIGSMSNHQKKHILAVTNQPHKPSRPQYQKPKLTYSEAAKILAALKEPIINNESILAYVSRVPEVDALGKFGLPQDKYRYGFYGHASMSYDIWSRVRHNY